MLQNFERENLLRTAVVLTLWLGFVAPAVAEQRFEFAALAIPEDGRIVVPVIEGDALNGIAAVIDERTAGALSVAAREAAFTGETGTTLTLLGVAPYSRIDLIGIGAETVSRAAAEDFGGTASALLGDTESGSVDILWPGENVDTDATAARVAFGYRLRGYRFVELKAEPFDRDKLPTVVLRSVDVSADEFANDLVHLADGVFF